MDKRCAISQTSIRRYCHRSRRWSISRPFDQPRCWWEIDHSWRRASIPDNRYGLATRDRNSAAAQPLRALSTGVTKNHQVNPSISTGPSRTTNTSASNPRKNTSAARPGSDRILSPAPSVLTICTMLPMPISPGRGVGAPASVGGAAKVLVAVGSSVEVAQGMTVSTAVGGPVTCGDGQVSHSQITLTIPKTIAIPTALRATDGIFNASKYLLTT